MRLTEQQKSAKQRCEWLKQSLQNNLVPAFIDRGFEVAPPLPMLAPVDREFVQCFPTWGRLRRFRGSNVDLVEIQLAAYRRAAFRINAGVAPKDGVVTHTGRQAADQGSVHMLEESFETHARPLLRPLLRALGLEPLWAWFSVRDRLFRSPVRDDFEKLSLKAVSLIPELELALRDGRTGPHVRRIVLPWSLRPRLRAIEPR